MEVTIPEMAVPDVLIQVAKLFVAVVLFGGLILGISFLRRKIALQFVKLSHLTSNMPTEWRQLFYQIVYDAHKKHTIEQILRNTASSLPTLNVADFEAARYILIKAIGKKKAEAFMQHRIELR